MFCDLENHHSVIHTWLGIFFIVLFTEPITINNMSLEVNSFRFLPENKHFSLTTIPQCSIGEAAQVLANGEIQHHEMTPVYIYKKLSVAYLAF